MFFSFIHFEMIIYILQKYFLRHEQDSNLRGETPLDFKSNALTTRPSWHTLVSETFSIIILIGAYRMLRFIIITESNHIYVRWLHFICCANGYAQKVLKKPWPSRESNSRRQDWLIFGFSSKTIRLLTFTRLLLFLPLLMFYFIFLWRNMTIS